MASRTLTPANQVTLLRLAFVPLLGILVMEQRFRAALLIMVAAAISDIVDGTIARLLHQETPLGVALDPIADKALMTTAYLTLAIRDVIPWWLTILVMSRDVAIIITALLISLVAGYRPFRPSILGKASTVSQVVAVFAALAGKVHIPLVDSVVVAICLYAAGILTVASGVHYLTVVGSRYAHHTAPSAASGSPQPENAATREVASREAESAKAARKRAS